MFAAISAVEFSWTAATFKSAFPPVSVPSQNRLTSQSTVGSIAPASVATDPAARVTRARAAGFSPVPPDHMPLLRGTRPLKRWRYVAIFCEELMACAATVQVGPARQTFWAVLLRNREPGEGAPHVWGSPSQVGLHERTRLRPRRGAVELTAGRLRVDDRSTGRHASALRLDLALEEDGGIATVCAHGGSYVWTRKQAGVAARGVIAIDGGAPRAIEARAVIDDTAGYHARRTEWYWAAGVGTGADGAPLAFNLVEGVNDPPSGSERAVWSAGEPREVAPVSFAADLTRISATDGSQLHFDAEAQRERRENLLLVRSEYRAPFGTFSGALPGGIALTQGLGVVEHHVARW